MARWGLLFLLIAGLGCGGNKAAEVDPVDAVDGVVNETSLASSVEVEVRANTVRLVLHVTNPSNQPATLEFSSGQRYDFAIRTADGADVWTWSADKQFMQALGSETIAPGQTIDFTETWEPGNRTGSFIAIATLTSTSHRIQEQASFELR